MDILNNLYTLLASRRLHANNLNGKGTLDGDRAILISWMKLDGVDTLVYFVVISPRDDHVTSKVPNFL